jgi:hypothetical protein
MAHLPASGGVSCYGLQIDRADFSQVVVIDFRA